MIRRNQQASKTRAKVTAEPALSALQRRQVKQMLTQTVELKAFEFTTANTTVSTSGTASAVTHVAQGVTDINRVGDRLLAKELELNYSITVGATGLVAAADQYNTVRIVVFKWLEDDGLAAPTVANVLDTAFFGALPSLSLYNWDTKHLYKILYDKSHVVFNTPVWNGTATAWYHGPDGTYVTPTPIRIPLKGAIDFDANTVFGKNHIYVLAISDSAFTPNPALVLNTRLIFSDA